MNDIQLNTEIDLLITNGDFAVGETTNQDIFLLLSCDKGSIRQHPTIGVGISNMLGDNDINAWKRSIREECNKMGLLIEKLNISNNGQIELQANYK
ncbi:MAG TPA: hypothetical protein VIO15_00790 [Bacteroidales bacterium]